MKIHEMTAKELKFGYYNMSTEDAERCELSDFRVFADMSCSCFSNIFRIVVLIL